MDLLNHSILSALLIAPLIGALLVLLAPGERAVRWLALLSSLATLLLSLHLPFHFQNAARGMQFAQDVPWISALNIHYAVGVDGISLWLVVLTTVLSLVSVLTAWNSIRHNVKSFYFLLLLLQAGIIGVFISLDLFLFYVCWEITLVPMALMIGAWGGAQRSFAAVKFFVYTMAGSLLMLGSILWLRNLTGTFNVTAIRTELASGSVVLAPHTEVWLFLGFLVAFCIKTPIFPLHTWQPLAYTEAPLPAVIMLAGLMSKMGAYGLIRFDVTLFPNASHRLATLVVVLGLIGVVYGGLLAFVQTNLKRIIAYSSLSHMGLVVVGAFSLTTIGTQGAVFQMISHGVTTAGLFLLVGVLYARRGSLELRDFGGIASQMPVFAGLFVWLAMAAVGLPLLSGFIGEFLIFLGAFTAQHWFGIIAALGVILSAMYLLRMTRLTIWGEPNATAAGNAAISDVGTLEGWVLAGLAILTLWLGVGSPLFLKPTLLSAQALQPISAPAPATNTASPLAQLKRGVL